MPRSSCARIVPELPRAPMSAPWAIACAASARDGSPSPVSYPANTASTAVAADSRVR
ncbi:hypothetical protein M878_12390 [Streptomyces roseochromogenus subsp. oscitans DS 12.976]|uniref:Uncharacterized protein n=1 Tax=Streptomyces roseochromogenus subsp. oscitans DS 12.976 TaxID=1352936 RepID=V6KNM5_STRRC|nr:hypothetical protein M878_12390 [Streptomyces roseochromogenus subsp. oscitans DS 12.976]